MLSCDLRAPAAFLQAVPGTTASAAIRTGACRMLWLRSDYELLLSCKRCCFNKAQAEPACPASGSDAYPRLTRHPAILLQAGRITSCSKLIRPRAWCWRTCWPSSGLRPAAMYSMTVRRPGAWPGSYCAAPALLAALRMGGGSRRANKPCTDCMPVMI
jgi:hypothetical protein